MSIQSKFKAKEISCSAVVTRADGTVKDFGVIAYKHRNPLKTWVWSFRKWLQSLKHS